MTRLLTILSILGSVASVIGLTTVSAGSATLGAGFLVALILALWVLLAPVNWIDNNVAPKAGALLSRRFRHPDGYTVVQQRGEKRLPSSGQFTIVFDTPMMDEPDVIFDRPDGQPQLEITAVSGRGVEFQATSGGYPCTVNWIATGRPYAED